MTILSKPTGMRYHRVRYGDTLTSLGALYYGKELLGFVIYQHNRHYIADPNQLFPGQELVIPYLSPDTKC